jgi:FtsH-binding integral membrane protein
MVLNDAAIALIVPKAAEGIPIFTAMMLEAVAARRSLPYSVRPHVLRERGRYTVALLLSSSAVASVYAFAQWNLTLFLTTTGLIVISAILFLAHWENLGSLTRIGLIGAVGVIILFEIDAVGIVCRLFGIT